MNAVTLESLSPTKVALTIEVDAKKVKDEREKVFQEMAKTVQLKGFRKGKAPRTMVEKLIDQELLRKELLRRLMNETYHEALRAHKIRPLTQPEVEVVRFEEGEPFTFKTSFERWPSVSLPEYKGVSVTVERREVKEEEVENVLQTLKEQKATYEDLPDGVVEVGRGALVDLYGSVKGKAFEGGEWKGLLLEIEKEWPVLPGLMEKMLGMKNGEERSIRVVLPSNFDPEVAGQEAVFDVRVHAVKQKKIPELTDAFAQTFGEEFKTVDDLRLTSRKQLQAWHDHEEKREGLKKVLEEWNQALDFPVPEILIEEKLKRFERETLQAIGRQGKTFSQFLSEKYPEVFSIVGVNDEEKVNRALSKFREELRPEAVKEAKNDVVLDEIAQQEALRITQEEVNFEIGRLSQSLGVTSEAVAKALGDKNVFQDFIGGMLRAKAALVVRDHLKISY